MLGLGVGEGGIGPGLENLKRYKQPFPHIIHGTWKGPDGLQRLWSVKYYATLFKRSSVATWPK